MKNRRMSLTGIFSLSPILSQTPNARDSTLNLNDSDSSIILGCSMPKINKAGVIAKPFSINNKREKAVAIVRLVSSANWHLKTHRKIATDNTFLFLRELSSQ